MLDLQKKPTDKCFSTIGTDLIRKKMGEVLDSVYFKGDEFIIERKQKQLAALVPIKKYRLLNNLAKDLILAALTKRTNPEISEAEADLLADEVKHLIRKTT